MSGADEDWVRAAMTEDAVVAELLIRLRHAPPPPPTKPSALPTAWTVRQRRSRPVSVNNNNNVPKKLAHRGSPTTPLSWSGATSVSGGSVVAAGSEESSRPIPVKLSTTARSKVDADSEKIASKRPRKKKTLTELKDEENSLLKERRELTREMAVLRMNLEMQRATNEKLKRMKIELQPCVDQETTIVAEDSVSGRDDSKFTACHPIPSTMPLPILSGKRQSATPDGCTEQNANAASFLFVVPDLNMPCEETSSDVIDGVS